MPHNVPKKKNAKYTKDQIIITLLYQSVLINLNACQNRRNEWPMGWDVLLCSLQYTIRKVQENQDGMDLNGSDQVHS